MPKVYVRGDLCKQRSQKSNQSFYTAIGNFKGSIQEPLLVSWKFFSKNF